MINANFFILLNVTSEHQMASAGYLSLGACSSPKEINQRAITVTATMRVAYIALL